MVKVYVLAVLIVITSCAGTKKNTYSGSECDIHFGMRIKKGSLNEPVTFLLTNPNLFDVEITRPDCMAGTNIALYNQAGAPAPAGIKVKVNSACLKEFIRLPARDSVEVVYPYTINKLFMVEKGATYRVTATYRGELKGDNRRCINISQAAEGSLVDTILTTRSLNH
ncbi:MAG: hypothetical protein J7621_09855 [Niastella sp.]|nr:hypothetical protein [Niastella sp.]